MPTRVASVATTSPIIAPAIKLTTVTMEQETFEDAQDTASVRSLTRRTPSVSKHAQEQNDAELEEEYQKLSKEPTQEDQTDGEKENDRKSSAFSTHRISQNSNGDLDNVNLDDDAATTDSRGLWSNMNGAVQMLTQ